MGGKKPRGSEPARGSSFSCRSRRGTGGAVVNEEQEFSLFSCLGVREIAPWLSEESTNNDSHRSHMADIKFSRPNPGNEDDCINGDCGTYDDRIKDLELLVNRMELKIKNLEGKHKDKENASGGLNIERFRTLEGRQAFQQSKFSSLDVAFGGTSSTVWNKGCKRLRDLLLKAEDSTCSITATARESTVLSLRDEQNSSTSTPIFEKSHDPVSSDNADHDRSPSCVSPSTVASSSPVVNGNKRSTRMDDNSKLLHVKKLISAVDSIVKEDGSATQKATVIESIDVRCAVTSPKNEDDRSVISESSTAKKERSATGASFEESVSLQVKSLGDYLDIHRSKVELQLKHILEAVTYYLSSEGRRNKSSSEDEHLAQYWAEIAALNDRIDCLIPQLKSVNVTSSDNVDNSSGSEGASDKSLLTSSKECETGMMTSTGANKSNETTNIETQLSDNLNTHSSKAAHQKQNDEAGSNRCQQSNERQSRSPQSESSLKNTKQQQHQNTRPPNGTRANAPCEVSTSNEFDHSCDSGNLPSYHNIQRYAFGYNNHLISGSNFYGYPPPYTQQVSSHRPNQVPNYQYQSRGYQSEIKSSWATAYSSRSYPLCGVAPDFNSSKPLGSMNSATYSNQRGNGSFDMAKDSMPLRYDSPMSPYASYYVYLPVSGVSTDSTAKMLSSDYVGEGDNGSSARDEAHEHDIVNNKEENM